MGVQGLWTILSPCARPVKLETLAHKRLAVDASIWIYQFLKAVRDAEGNVLRNSHIVGFFRRICKLLFFGIKPVFVFDGAAPQLKRRTIAARKGRREGRREDAVRTAGRLLAVQMRRRLELERERVRREREQRKKDAAEGWQNVEITTSSTTGMAAPPPQPQRHPNEPEEEPMPANPVYVDELTMTPQQRRQNRTFKKQDPYHLPDLDMSIEHMGAPNDPRVMSPEELAQYAAQFRENGDDDSNVNLYDFSKIDFSSPFFLSLPINDQYAILSAARLRSRLRMGLSKDQLATMFPNRLDFSKFQIERVRERNELTQRLMNLNGMNAGGDTYEAIYGSGRIAGEKGREYVLVKNDGVEGGWVLGVVGRKEGVVAKQGPGKGKFVEKTVPGESVNQPIVIDAAAPRPVVIGAGSDEDEEEDEEDEFEDVPIEGLNRIPKLPPHQRPRRGSGSGGEEEELVELERQQLRQALYESRKEQSGYTRPKPQQQQGDRRKEDDHGDSLFFAGGEDEVMHDVEVDEMFSPTREDIERVEQIDEEMGEDDEDMRRAIANSMNETVGMESDDEDFKRAIELSKQDDGSSPEARKEKGKGKGKGKQVVFDVSDDEDEDMDLQAAMRESRKKQSSSAAQAGKIGQASRVGDIHPVNSGTAPKPQGSNNNSNNPFGGLLPFESIPLDFGNSILGKKKKDANKPAPDTPTPQQQPPIQPQPQTRAQQRDYGGFEPADSSDEEQGGFVKDTDTATGPADQSPDTANNALPLPPWFSKTADIRKELQNEERAIEIERVRGEELQEREKQSSVVVLSSDEEKESDSDVEMLDVLPKKLRREKEVVEARKEGRLGMDDLADVVRAVPPVVGREKGGGGGGVGEERGKSAEKEDGAVEGKLEAAGGEVVGQITAEDAAGVSLDKEKESGKPAVMEGLNNEKQPEIDSLQDNNSDPLGPPEKLSDAEIERLADEADEAIEADFSDPEDVELMNQLQIEAEEHARFASSLQSKDGGVPPPALTAMQTAAEYERDLKALRLQQKADRRDADEVTQTMITECQQLLTLFGLPFITAPMEAEAQCAELVHLGLVDGIVTDDSDCFLFGGTRVYKNMFNQAKFVECYLLNDLEKEFALDRNRLICLAHLLGSDYTEGLPGIGPVLALELLTEFAVPPDGNPDTTPSGPLFRFRDWWKKVQASGGLTYDGKNDSPFLKKLRKSQSTKLFLPESFPLIEVDEAYLRPEVDDDPSRFEWGVPDMDGIRTFLMETIGWSQERADEVLVPVVRDMNRRLAEGTQSNITRYFEGAVGAGAFAPRKRGEGRSKRMDKARERLHKIAERAAAGFSGSGNVGGDDDDDGHGGDAEDGEGTASRGPPISLRDSTAPLPPVSNRGGRTTKSARGSTRKAPRGGRGGAVSGGSKASPQKKKRSKAVESASSSSSSSVNGSPVRSDGEDEDEVEERASGEREVVAVVDSDEHEGVGAGNGRKRKAGGARGAAKRGRGRGGRKVTV